MCEAIEIKEKDPYMKRDVGKLALSPIWDFTVRKVSRLDFIHRKKH